MKYSGIGGQAVIEGIMMKNGDNYATAVRKPDGEIEVQEETYVSLTEKVKLFALPFVRGIFSFADSMILGMKTLTFSASFFEDDEEGEPSKFEAFLDRVFGEKLEKVLMAAVMVFSFILAVGIFMVLPLFIAGFFRGIVKSDTGIAFLEGVIRLAIFIIYIKAVSMMEDIKRTFMYHGAEHKCINCIEHGMPLTVENVRKSSRQHKRCGTSFLFFVMIVSIIFCFFITAESQVLKVGIRIALMPVIAGVSYEIIRLAGSSENPLVNVLSKPGMWVQMMTTKEPDDSMIEVAIRAVEEVFDWKAYLEENFSKTEESLGENKCTQEECAL